MISAKPRLRPAFAPQIPIGPLQPLLRRIVRFAVQHNSDALARLGPHTHTTYLLDPIDLSFVFSLQLDPQSPQLRAHRRSALPAHEARISGRLRDLIKLADGQVDGDALFFSRALQVQGNTEAIVLLRNMLDNLESDPFVQICGALGPFAPLARWTLDAVRGNDSCARN